MTEEVKDQQPSELDMLKARAKQMNLKHHHNIGVDKLKKLVNDALVPEVALAADSPVRAPVAATDERFKHFLFEPANAPKKNMSPREKAARLVRIRVNCMNPNKQEWEGEIFTVGNTEVGTFKKFIPFNNEEGWHVPNIILEHLRERDCQIFITKKDDRGNKTRVGKLIKEFAIEVMDPLTNAELKELEQRQAIANGTEAAAA